MNPTIASGLHVLIALSPVAVAGAAVFASSRFGAAAAAERRLREVSTVERLATTSKLLADLIRSADGRGESFVVGNEIVNAAVRS